MCRLAAIVGSAPAQADVDAAAAAIAGRGPDGTARYDGDGLVLVASRLAHWEEGAPRQPWVGSGADKGVAAAFNGELFNLPELQELLGQKSASEIEVLVTGLRDLGPAFLRHIDGQFAAVIRPSAGGPVLAVRDRFGIAPLYWAELPDGVAFASNLGAALALRGTEPEYDLDGLASILAEWAPIGALSPYVGIHQVRPGHVLFVENGRVVDDRRWSQPVSSCRDTGTTAPADTADSATGTALADEVLPPPSTPFASGNAASRAAPASGSGAPPTPISDAELDDLEAALRHAVKIRLRSTGRVACLLSGGVDSTVIGALAADEGATLGLSLCLEGDDLVAERQRQVADALGMELIQHILTPAETVELFEEYVRTRHMPLVRLGPIGMMALARRARAEGIRAVLSGEGADELFAGYDSYRILAARGGLFGPVKGLPWAEFGTPEFGADRGPTWAKSYWRGLIQFSQDAGARRLDILRPVADAFAPPLRDVILGERPAPSAVETGPSPSTDPAAALTARREVDLAHLLAGYLLTVQGDHAWMEEGVELRPPYLAAPVADWALRHSPAQFVSIATGKLPVRALLRRLTAARPALADLDVAKAAFRVDANFLRRAPTAFAAFRGLMPVQPGAAFTSIHTRPQTIDAQTTSRPSEAESMLSTLRASCRTPRGHR